MVRHLVEVTLRHYDPELRSQAAMALGEVVKQDSAELVSALIDSQIGKLATRDVALLHGTLLSLAALAPAAETVAASGADELKLKVSREPPRAHPQSRTASVVLC